MEVHPFIFLNVFAFTILIKKKGICFYSMCFGKIDRCCVIALQVHDELVMEVDPSLTKEAALLLRMSMENAALLLGMPSMAQNFYIPRTCSFCSLFMICFSVPLHIKLKVGRTWGSLEPFQADQFWDELLCLIVNSRWRFYSGKGNRSVSWHSMGLIDGHLKQYVNFDRVKYQSSVFLVIN